MLTIIFSTFIGTLLCLDRIALQSMVSRPLVTATIIGFALGELYAALVIGSMLELLWIDKQPIGNKVLPNDTVVAVLAITVYALAVKSIATAQNELIVFTLLFFIPVGILTQKIDSRLIDKNTEKAETLIEEVAQGNSAAVSYVHLSAIARYFATYSLLLFFFLLVGYLLVPFTFPFAMGFAGKALRYCFYLMPLLGAAVALKAIRHKKALVLFCFGFLLTAVLRELFYAL